MSLTAGSTKPLAETVTKAAVVTHGKAAQIGPALERLQKVAADAQVDLLLGDEEAAKHGLGPPSDDTAADIAVVLGGDGTMLRALTRFLGTGVPVIGVNFGRVGFLSSIAPSELETGLTRVFAGDYVVCELPTLEVETETERRVAVNDAVVASALLGRMVELEWAVGGEDLGRQPCDGIICSTPSGSTAYNLSNGGPVLMWGLDAMAITFVAPHSLHARPLVVSRGRDVVVCNRTPDVPTSVLVDGHHVAEIRPRSPVVVRLGPGHSLLATLPEVTFTHRYRSNFAA
jgi:NAD+ kinase